MSKVSQEELYNDKDVVTQILKLKDTVNDYAGGIIENIDVSGNDLVIDWASGESVSLPLPSPTGISSIAGSVSGGNLTITIYMTDGSSHAFTCPLAGMASEAYVDAGLATKADAADVYTKGETDTLLAGKVNSSDAILTTGAQTKSGILTLTDVPKVVIGDDGGIELGVNGIVRYNKVGSYGSTLTGSTLTLVAENSNGSGEAHLAIQYNNDGSAKLILFLRRPNDTYAVTTVATLS